MVRGLHISDSQCDCPSIVLFVTKPMEYEINRGIGREVEFRGLTSLYLFLFAGGLLAAFLLVVVLHLCGVPQSVYIVSGIVTATFVVFGTFYLNRKYGRWGLMKSSASRRRPRRILRRQRVSRIFRTQRSINIQP